MMDPHHDRDFAARTNRDEVARLTAELREVRMQALSDAGQAADAYAAQCKAEAQRDNAHRTIALLLKLHQAHHNHMMHAAARALLAGQGA